MAIYLDHNATTPLAGQVQAAMIDSMKQAWQNPSCRDPGGQLAGRLIRSARQSIARLIGCQPAQVIFTSGGTEANNWVIRDSVIELGRQLGRKAHVVISCVEHDSVAKPLLRLEQLGLVEVTRLPVDPGTGAVGVDDLLSALRPGSTTLVSVMWANNETGAIFPIAELARRIADWRRSHWQQGDAYASLELPWFHSDAAQAVGKVEVLASDQIDFITIVGHKFRGPRIGALYARKPELLSPWLIGGGQEAGLRAGTENTPMIVGLGVAADLAVDSLAAGASDRLCLLRCRLESALESALNSAGFDMRINNRFPAGQILPNTLNLSIIERGSTTATATATATAVEARDWLLLGTGEDACDVVLGAGSACHAGGLSAVLLASFVPPEAAAASLRLSVGLDTSEEEIDTAAERIGTALKRFRESKRNIGDGQQDGRKGLGDC